MKKITLIATIILFSCLTFKSADAQLRISLGFNIGSQPDWGPVGYDHASYYYMPDIDTYYDVNSHQYVYLQNNVWIHSGSLPVKYRNYNLYSGYKVVVNDRNPWEHAATYRTKYASYKGRRNQQVIRDSRDNRYQNHWRGDNNGRGNGHDNGRGNNGHNNGRGNDHGNGHDKH